jgi:hypothetical protein
VWGIFGAVWFTAVGFLSLILLQYTANAPYGFLPIPIAELSTGLWLLLVGIKIPPQPETRGAEGAASGSADGNQ